MTFEEVLEIDGRIIYTNVGISMLPLLRQNRDIMVIEKASTYKKYDAVLFVRPNVSGRRHYVLHRILKVNSSNYWIVGDNCVSGEYVAEENILGVLTYVIRDGKQIEMSSLKNKLYIYCWCAPYPIRFFLLRLKSIMVRVIRKGIRIFSK